MRILLVADIKNLFYSINKKFPERKLNFEKLLGLAKEKPIRACAYGLQMDNEASPFITRLECLGFDTYYKQSRYPGTNWACGITLQIMEMFDRLDTIILASSDNDFIPLISFLRAKGIEIIIVGANVSRDIKNNASSFIEINEDLLETVNVPNATE